MPAPRTEPRLPAIIALLAVGGIYTALPPFLTLGPRWLLLAVVSGLLIPTVVSLRTGHYRLNRALGYVVSAVITLALVVSLVLLIKALPTRAEAAPELLRSAGALWLANILVFALWNWRIVGGAPVQSYLRRVHMVG